MKIRQVMTPNPVCLSPDATLAEAAEQMRQIDCGFVPVAHDGRIQGVITDRDIVVRAVAERVNPRTARLKDHMTRTTVHCCHEDDDVSQAVRLMKEKHIRRLPILDRQERLVGVFSLGDLATQARDRTLCGEVLEQVSIPTRRQPRMGAA